MNSRNQFYSILLSLFVMGVAHAQRAGVVFDPEFRSGTYEIDINNDGTDDLLVVGYNSTGNAHSFYTYDLFILNPVDQRLHKVAPSFVSSAISDCVTSNIRLVKLDGNDQDYKVVVIDRTGQVEGGNSISTVEFNIFDLQRRESPGSRMFSYDLGRSVVSENKYCSVEDAFENEWEAISNLLVGEMNLSGEFEEPSIVIIPAGTFRMGVHQFIDSHVSKIDGFPGHPISFDHSFGIGATEVTFAQYDYFAKATGRMFPDDNGWGRGDRPVINVTWSDARDYVAWLSEETGKSYRLPTESEWEYSAKAGSDSRHFFGNTRESILGKANCKECFHPNQSPERTVPVRSYPANAFGLYDMHGNVEEWVQDDYVEYEEIPTDGSASMYQEGIWSIKVVRGSHWNSPFIRVSSTIRGSSSDPMNFKSEYRGFRVALDLE